MPLTKINTCKIEHLTPGVITSTSVYTCNCMYKGTSSNTCTFPLLECALITYKCMVYPHSSKLWNAMQVLFQYEPSDLTHFLSDHMAAQKEIEQQLHLELEATKQHLSQAKNWNLKLEEELQVKQKRMAFLVSQFEQQQRELEMLKQQGKARENIADSDIHAVHLKLIVHVVIMYQ